MTVPSLPLTKNVTTSLSASSKVSEITTSSAVTGSLSCLQIQEKTINTAEHEK